MKVDNRRNRHIEKLMRRVPISGRNAKAVPRRCRQCEFYQPHFRFRICTFSYCRYGLDREIFRKHPLKEEKFAIRKEDN